MLPGTLSLRMRPAQVILRSEHPYDPGEDARNARGDARIAIIARSCEGGSGEGNQQQGNGNGSLRHDSSYGCGQLNSSCGMSTFTILAMTREMREAIPGSRSSLEAANAGVERATSNKATETVLFDMIPP